MSKNRGQTFMFGAVILIISNIAVKLIGALLKIPLTNILGVGGMASYNAAYGIYVTFYTISTAGIPVAVSRMIAMSNSKNNTREIRKIFEVAFGLFFVIGLLGTGAMMIFARQFANSSGMPNSYLAMLAIAPTIFFICLSSAYRGYFQGMQNMIPTAVSQVIESAVKLGIGLIAALYFKSQGYPAHVTAAYVILGVTIGVLLGCVYGAICKKMFTSSKEYIDSLKLNNLPVRSHKSLLCELIIIAVPITLASSIMGLTKIVDIMFLSNGLQTTGLTVKAAEEYYGAYSSIVDPLFNLVPPFIYTFGISAIPAISASVATGDMVKVKKDVESAFRNCSIIAIPCAVGLGVLSKEVIAFLYKNEEIVSGKSVVTSIELAAPALTVISAGILFLGVISITNSILQAFSKEKYTIISTMTGIIVKAVSTYFLSRVPGFGVLGSAVGTLLCYFTIMAINVFLMIRLTHIVPRISKIFVKPFIAGVSCGVAALGVVLGFGAVGFGGRLVTVASIGAAVVVYLVILLALKSISRYDVMMMPKGEKLCRVLDKFNLLEKSDD